MPRRALNAPSRRLAEEAKSRTGEELGRLVLERLANSSSATGMGYMREIEREDRVSEDAQPQHIDSRLLNLGLPEMDITARTLPARLTQADRGSLVDRCRELLTAHSTDQREGSGQRAEAKEESCVGEVLAPSGRSAR